MSWTPRESWAVKLSAALVPPLEAAALLDALGPDGLDRADDAAWTAASGIRPDDVAWMRRDALRFDARREEDRAGALGARLIVRGSPDYPELLENIYDPPLVLYLQGAFGAAPPVAFVGSRFPTPYGARMARTLAGDAARAGVAVVSGLARGIDAEAHTAALDAGGVTWAVLGSGLDRVYPDENRSLARRIVAEGGALLSEMALSTSPDKKWFPRRNRVVAGLSWVVVVVEGRDQSGSLITARLAGECGRDLLAVPGPADSPLSYAPHRLLTQGAGLATTVADVLAALPEGVRPGPVRTARPVEVPAAPPTGEEAKILALLGADALSLDELTQLSGLDTARISSIMFGLEIKERVTSVPGQRYAQKAR